MPQSLAVWIVIVLAFATASLPFLLQRHLLALPWAQPGEPARPALLRIFESLVFFALLIGWCALARPWLGDAYIGADCASAPVLWAKALGVLVLGALLLACAA